MSDRILRWGLLGTARINRSLIPPLRSSMRNQLVAVASRDKHKGVEYAQEWKIERVFDNYEALLASPDIDVVYVSLPNSLHAEWTIRALRAGKHVLCEKPIATRVEDVDAIAAAAAETGQVVTEGFMYRHHPQTSKVRELIDGGAIGTVRLVRGSFTFNLTDRANVRLRADLDGGCLWDLGCYPINYARTVIGLEPVEVMGAQFTGDTGVDETFVGHMRFENGAYAQFDSGFCAPLRTNMEIVGTEGLLVVPRPYKPTQSETIYVGEAHDRLAPVHIAGPELLYLAEVEDIADAVLKQKPPRIGLEDSRNNVATIVALLQSSIENRPRRM